MIKIGLYYDWCCQDAEYYYFNIDETKFPMEKFLKEYKYAEGDYEVMT